MKYSCKYYRYISKNYTNHSNVALDSLLLSIADIETIVPIKQSDPPIIKETPVLNFYF